MAKKTITGKVVTIVDNQNQKTAAIELSPAIPGKDGKPGTAAKTFQITTNDHDSLPITRGQVVTVTIETK